VARKDLKKLGYLGFGAFGSVELCENPTTGKTYALKGLSKGYIVKEGSERSVFSERDVLLQCDIPFIIKLHQTYNSSQMLYFLLEAALGGELMDVYNTNDFWGFEEHAKFYGAGLDNQWKFWEPKEYLQHAGALDETNPKSPSVIIPNYVYGMNNCLASSSFFAVCSN